MTDRIGNVQVGHPAPDFMLECYDPVADDFGEISLDALKQAGKWTILLFYTADFSSV